MRYARRRYARRAGLGLVTLVLVVGCTDEQPTGPPPEPPQAPLTPSFIYTGVDCPENNCLRDDVEGSWTVVPAVGATYYLVLEDSNLPTTRGGTMYASWCAYSTIDDSVLSCYESTGWYRSMASYPDRTVFMQGSDGAGQFIATSPVPELEVLEYERPAQPNCYSGWCVGKHRIKVRLHHAGWFNGPITVSIEKSTGERWPGFQDHGYLNGEELEIIWDSRIFWPDDGSRILIEYRPWQNQWNYVLYEIYLPISQESPTLTLDANPSVVDSAGEPVTFTAAADGAELIEVLSWTWTPDDPSGTPQTVACALGENPCITPVYESGTMEVEARVDGRVQAASAHVSATAQIELQCSNTNPVRGDWVTCQAFANPASATLQGTEWIFTDGTYEVSGPVGETSWGGQIVISGTVTVSGLVDGEPKTTSVNLSVTARVWPDIASTVSNIGNGSLVLNPQSAADLASTTYRLSAPILGDTITDGPNQGYTYIPGPLPMLNILVMVSDAFQPGSAWRSQQVGGLHSSGGPYCKDGPVIDLIKQRALVHEGLIVPPAPGDNWIPNPNYSHVSVIQYVLALQDPQYLFEDIVVYEGLGSVESLLTMIGNRSAVLNNMINEKSPPQQHQPTPQSPNMYVPPAQFPCYLRPWH